ncbi:MULTISPECIES: hypothetical protein [Bacillus]|uniref:hypothetical protein n=1 Tax=Bacillus TaxID=1386 RepID=UPI001C02EA13|nr:MULTISPECIES: hypothetical protein [Bacillus]QWU48118.1 hypothetical protein KPL75_19065 [Bacillus sp. NP247]
MHFVNGILLKWIIELFLLLSRYSNYDANSNYKSANPMKPEEIKKELEGMLEEALKR